MRGRWRIRVLCVLSLLPFLGATSGGGGLPQPSADGSPPPHIRIAARAAEPFLYQDDGRPRGLDLDLINVACSMLGWTYDLQWVSMQEAVDGLRAGTLDMAAGGIYVTPERSKDLLFTRSYLRTGIVVVTRSDDHVGSPKDLAGRRVGVRRLAASQTLAEELDRRLGLHLSLTAFETSGEGLKALRDGQVDAVLNDYQNSLYVIPQRYPGQLTIARGLLGPLMLSHDSLAFAFRRGMVRERDAFDGALERMHRTGLLDQFADKWLLEKPPVEPRRYAAWGAAALTAALLFGVALFFWLRNRARLKSLAQSERITRELIDGSPVGVLIHRGGALLYLNQTGRSMFGVGPEEQLRELAVTDLVVPEERERVAAFARGRLSGQVLPDRYKTLGLRRSGGRFATEVWVAPATLADGPATLVFLKDVDEQERILKALEKSERDYRELFEKASDAILILDPQTGAILDANPQACELYGRSTEELLKTSVLELSTDPSRLRLRLADIRSRGALPVFETTHLHKDGRQIHLEVNASSVEYRGRPAILSMHRDVTARRLAEAAMRESEKRLRALMESAGDAVFLADADTGMLVDANLQAQELIGRSLDEIRRMSQAELHPPEERERYREIFRQHIQSGKALSDYLEVVHRDGRRIPVEISASTVEVGGRRINQGFFRDVSKRRAAEAALKESEERFRALAESTSAGILIYQDESFQYVNPAALRMTGYTAEEIQGKRFWDLVHPDHRELVRQRGLARQRGEAVPSRYEFKILTKDGRTLWMDFSAGLVQWQGRPAGVVTAFDVTERKRAEEAVKDSEHQLRLLVDNIQEVIHYNARVPGTDVFRPTFISSQIENLLGYKPEEFSEHPGRWLECVHPDDRETMRGAPFEVLSSPEPHNFEYRFLHGRTGEYLWFEDRVIQDAGPDGAVVGFFGVARDITDRKRAEQELRRKNLELSSLLASAQAMSTFLDLKGAAQAICGAAIQAFDCRMAWIGLVVPEGTEVRVLASAGHDEGYTDKVRVRWDLSERAMGPTGRAIKERRPVVMNIEDPPLAPWREAALQRSFRSICALPLLHEETVRGALTIYSSDPEGFPAEEITAMEIFARQATMAVVNAALYEEAKQTIEELGALNEELTSAQEQQRLQFEALEESQRRLEESETRFRQLAETADAAIFIARDFRYLYVNSYMERSTGYSREELLAMDSWSIVHPDDRAKVRDPAFAQRDLSEGTVHYEIRIVRKDGDVRWVEISGGLLDFGGQRTVIGTAYDITGRKQALEALEASRRRFRDLAENTADWIWEVGPDLRYTYCSPRSVDLLGYAPEELLGRSPLEFMPPAEAERVGPVVAGHSARREGFRGLLNRNLRKDGREVVLETSAVPVLDDRGAFRGYRGIDRDVTERLKSEEALRDSERRFKQIVEHSTNLFYTHTADHVLTYVSPQSRHFLGCDPEEARIRWIEFLTDNPANAKGVELTQRAIDTGLRQPPYELELRTKDGRVIWVQVNETPLVQEGRVTAIVGALTDITSRKHAEADLIDSERRHRAIVEQARAVVIKFDRRLNLTYWNDFATEVFGFSREEVLGRCIVGTIVPETESTGRDLRRLLAEIAADPNRFASNINQNVTKDGRGLWMAWTNRPILSARGELEEVLSLATDITALKESELAQKESVEALRRLRALSPVPLVAVDPEATVQEWNEAARRLTGWREEEVRGKTCPLLASSGMPGFKAFLARAEREGQASQVIPRCRLKDGRRASLKAIAVPLRDPAGRTVSLQVILAEEPESELPGGREPDA